MGWVADDAIDREADAWLAETVAAARAGSVEAFERLYSALAGRVAGYLRFNGVVDVDGLTNEVMAEVHRGLSRFEGDAVGFRSWVFTIAHHRMVDDRRRARRRPAVVWSSDAPEIGAGDVEVEAMDAMADHRLRALLDGLSADQRDVLMLRVVADLSLEEAARSLGKTVGAVKSLQHRALASLRRLLDEEVRDEL